MQPVKSVFNFSINSASLYSVSIFFDSGTVISFLAYYLLSFVTHLVLFTIPCISGGVPDVGPSSSVL